MKKQPRLPVLIFVCVVALVGIDILWTLWVELKFPLEAGKWLWVRNTVLVAAFSLVMTLPSMLRQSVRRFSVMLTWVLLVLFGLYTLLQLMSVYTLHTSPFIELFCSMSPGQSLCQLVSTTFFQLRIYRFITLSPLFFIRLLMFFVSVQYIPQLRVHFGVKKTQILKGILFIYLVVLIATQSQLVLARIHTDTVQAALNAQTPFADRFTYRNGGASYYGWIWPYTQFVNRHTAETATILVPPKSSVWKMESNIGYLRWFTYPRTLIQPTNLADNTIPAGVKYILLVEGECPELSCRWPSSLPTPERVARIQIIDRETSQEREISYEELQNVQSPLWGIIEVKE